MSVLILRSRLVEGLATGEALEPVVAFLFAERARWDEDLSGGSIRFCPCPLLIAPTSLLWARGTGLVLAVERCTLSSSTRIDVIDRLRPPFRSPLIESPACVAISDERVDVPREVLRRNLSSEFTLTHEIIERLWHQ